MPHKEPLIVRQVGALQAKIEAEGKLTLNSELLPEIEDWQTGETYQVNITRMRQVASRELPDGTIESDFEILRVENG